MAHSLAPIFYPFPNMAIAYWLLKEKKVKSLSHVRLFATPWTTAYQALPSMGFSRQEYWSGLPFPSPGTDHWRPTSNVNFWWDIAQSTQGVNCLLFHTPRTYCWDSVIYQVPTECQKECQECWNTLCHLTHLTLWKTVIIYFRDKELDTED